MLKGLSLSSLPRGKIAEGSRTQIVGHAITSRLIISDYSGSSKKWRKAYGSRSTRSGKLVANNE